MPKPWDTITGNALPPGPIRLADHQKRIVNEALRRKPNGKLVYSTVIYSAPKKSGKSAIAAAVANYMADITDFGNIYCLANDGKQSNDRLFNPIVNNYTLQTRNNGPWAEKVVSLARREGRMVLSNDAKIEAINCDASGEAGSEPTGVFFSELWGYDTDAKRRLFTEMTIPPTLYGYAIRWVESYAGYEGVSDLLWELYMAGRKSDQAYPHPDFLDLVDDVGDPVVWVNDEASMFTYWDTIPRMVWQDDEYYRNERQIHNLPEFERVHRNKWVSPVGSYIQPEWWDSCFDPEIRGIETKSKRQVVVGIDAAIVGDCAAIVAVARNEKFPMTDVDIVGARIFKPSGQYGIDLEETIGKTLRHWIALGWNIICVVFDSYQMETLVHNYRGGQVTIKPEELTGMNEEEQQVFLKTASRSVQLWYKKFGQQQPRAIADKRLYDMVQSRQIHWNDFESHDIASDNQRETLTKHVKQAGAKDSGNQMRIEKLTKEAKVDGAVALSMANQMCMQLNISAKKEDVEDLYKQVADGGLTYQELLDILAARRVKVND